MIMRLVLIVMLLAVGYFIFRPELIPNESVQQKVLGIKDQLPKDDSLPGKAADWITKTASQTYTQVIKNVKVPTEISGLPEEVVVEEAVKQLGEKLKSLPYEQAYKAKQNFCADIVTESQQ